MADSLVDSIRETQEFGRLDPDWFCESALGVKLWSKQSEIMQSVRDNTYTAVRSCHGAGKSFTAACTALWFLYCHPGSIVVTTAPTFRQVESIMWREINSLASRWQWPGGFPGETLKTRINMVGDAGWIAFGFSSDNPDKIQGLHANYILAVLDEAGGVNKQTWDGVKTIMTGGGARLLAIGNPTDPTSAFKPFCEQGNVNCIHISAFDTPNMRSNKIIIPGMVDKSWVDDMRESYGVDSAFYKSRVLGEFPTEGVDTLLPLHLVEKAVDREDDDPADDFEPIVLAADIARFGDDSSVLAMRQGSRVRILEQWRKADTVTSARKIAKWALSIANETGNEIGKRITINVDGTGLGAGVYDILQKRDIPCVNCEGARSSRQPDRYLNKRAEMYWALRDAFIEGRLNIILPSEDRQARVIKSDILGQLPSIRYKMSAKDQIQIESKEAMKKRGMSSPDVADAIAMLFYNDGVTSDRDWGTMSVSTF